MCEEAHRIFAWLRGTSAQIFRSSFRVLKTAVGRKLGEASTIVESSFEVI